MISALWLVLIVPVSIMIGAVMQYKISEYLTNTEEERWGK